MQHIEAGNYLTIKELAIKCGVVPLTIKRWYFHEGKIPYVRIGNLVRFKESDVKHLFKK